MPGVWSPGVCRLSVGLASCSFEGKTGEKLEKEVAKLAVLLKLAIATLGTGTRCNSALWLILVTLPAWVKLIKCMGLTTFIFTMH